ncbi:MAG: hypothetical protein IKN53_06810 [Oscillibacter sp.]|nr:hypothetical protein [Oscillibacter sp.]
MEQIIAAAVTGFVTLTGVLIANRTAQAVTDEKIGELTREVREHNNFARRVPVVEEQIRGMERRITQLEHGKSAARQPN